LVIPLRGVATRFRASCAAAGCLEVAARVRLPQSGRSA